MQVISDDHLARIASFDTTNWDYLPSYLEASDSLVERTVDQESGDEHEKWHDFLVGWKKAKGWRATYDQLINALTKIDCALDAEKVQCLLEESPYGSAGMYNYCPVISYQWS